ncbi:class I SAM-dependent methyltransferase [Proteus faecis]|uniref:class I SAM-dependent methyltransferase n=1 Tax=Proteus faecis TaxID=2050967 RepID=UPI003075C110
MSSKFSHIKSISSQELASEWDGLASERHRQICSGLDITFTHVMVPLVESLISQDIDTTLIDIGSGTGELTKLLAMRFERVICIEPSTRSIEVAKSALSTFSNIRFINSYFEDCEEQLFYDSNGKNIFLAAMMLSATPKIDRFAQVLSKVTHRGDEFIATIPHPCFWPRYWGYEKESWFSYKEELMIKAPFKISLSDSEFKTTHIHRPIEKYISTFSKYGFNLLKMSEPMPSQEIESLYPKKWDYPRFLAFKWLKN